jgi:hypothetical protein
MTRVATTEGSSMTVRAALPAILLAFVVSRIVLVAIVLIVEATGFRGDPYAYAGGPLGALTGYDSIYYLGIAAEGYHLQPIRDAYLDWAFFPAYPLLVKALDVVLPGDVAVAGVLLANGLLLAAMVLVARLMADHGDGRGIKAAMWLLVFAPGAVAFGMAYSDSLLLAASAGAILAVRRGGTAGAWLAALLLAVAALSRPPGILLVIPLAIAIWQADGLRSRRYLLLAAGPLALLGFSAYQGAVLGDPLAFLHAQAAWVLPTVVQGASGAAPAPSLAVTAVAVLLLVTLLAYTAMLPGLWRSKLPRAEVAWAFATYVSVFLSGRLQSDARYLAAGWPFAWFLGTRRSRWVAIAIGLSVVGYVLYGCMAIARVLPP